MSDIEAKKRVVRRYIDARRTFDAAVLDEVLHPDFVHYMHGRRETRQELFERLETERGALGVFEELESDSLDEGDQVALRYKWRGQHPQTGEPITFSGMFIAVVEDGQMTTGWGEFDRLSIQRQIERGNR